MATDGDEIGRFNDTDLQGFGNYANGLGQALAILALDRTAGGVPADAVDFLLDQQCPDGSFRLYYFGYVTSFDPFETVDDLTCTDPADGDVDATALALSALLAVPSTPAVADAIDDAVVLLAGAQLPVGWLRRHGRHQRQLHGPGGARPCGRRATSPTPTGPRRSSPDLQLRTCADFGALAYDERGVRRRRRGQPRPVDPRHDPGRARAWGSRATPTSAWSRRTLPGSPRWPARPRPLPASLLRWTPTAVPPTAVASGALRQIPVTGTRTGTEAAVGLALVAAGAALLMAGSPSAATCSERRGDS